ncbi:hypothetical protein NUSPORA_02361 [Nucleospora cyclopteri]
MKLIICSNRLPLTIKKQGKSFSYKKTSGGLVTGIESLSRHIDFVWFGNISGMKLNSSEKEEIKKTTLKEYNSIPVFIDPILNKLCYNGFCNSILWPCLHSFPDDVCFTTKEYEAYKEYNQIFADKILEIAEDDDIVWAHDYHLMLLPEIIKKRNKSIKVMFFLHTAFCEPANLLPLMCAKEILTSVSYADVVGFHTPNYASNFSAALKEYKIERTPIIRAISIGIDPEMFKKELEKEECKKRIREIKKIYKDKKIVLGVDRTDYIKGMPQKFKGIERFYKRMATDSKNKHNVVFIQIAIPSRLSVKEYSAYVKEINGQIQHINGTVGDVNTTPIKMRFGSVSFTELCALYAASDAILISSIIDGMNLVAMEYVACQNDNKGTVILSEFTGAMITLQGSIIFNPNNSEEIALAIEKALEIPSEKREKNHRINITAVNKFTSVGWATESLNCISADWKQEISKDINE